MSDQPSTSPTADATVRAQQRMQTEQDRRDAAADLGGESSARTAAPGLGHREPEPPFPRQHLTKPGVGHDMDLARRYAPPHYRGSG